MNISLQNCAFIIAFFAVLSFAFGYKPDTAGAFYQEASPEAEEPQDPKSEDDAEDKTPKFEGTMTIKRMNEIVLKIDKDANKPQEGAWQFRLANFPIMIVTDTNNNRMRMMVPIVDAKTLTKEDLMRIAQANFDSALDARYAVAQDVLWAVYIHPLRALYDRQFVSALAQTVTTAATYGKSYSSGAFVFGGGDSQGIIQQQLIDQLKDKGLEI